MSKDSWQDYADKVAYHLVPPGWRGSVISLRKVIATTLLAEIKKATDNQRDNEFPDLVDTKKELAKRRQDMDDEIATMNRKHRDKERELDDRSKQLTEREIAVQVAEEKLATLVQAFADYMAWLEGDGEVDDNGKRFNNLQQAYHAYQGDRK